MLLVKNDKRVRKIYRENPKLAVSREGYQILMLQLKTYKVKLKEKPCYSLRLGSGCNLDKDLSWEVGKDQLVKYKDTGLYLQLYISIVLEENVL